MAKATRGPASWDRDHLLDLFSSFGPITLKRMFSGFGISVDGINFAMALRAGIIFRVDERTIANYDAEGARPFQYTTAKRTIVVQSYRHIPERLYDDGEEFALWAREALEAARCTKRETKGGAGKVGKMTAKSATRKGSTSGKPPKGKPPRQTSTQR